MVDLILPNLHRVFVAKNGVVVVVGERQESSIARPYLLCIVKRPCFSGTHAKWPEF
jgi:hypothetical protein